MKIPNPCTLEDKRCLKPFSPTESNIAVPACFHKGGFFHLTPEFCSALNRFGQSAPEKEDHKTTSYNINLGLRFCFFYQNGLKFILEQRNGNRRVFLPQAEFLNGIQGRALGLFFCLRGLTFSYPIHPFDHLKYGRRNN
jgi:hypothetical protein